MTNEKINVQQIKKYKTIIRTCIAINIIILLPMLYSKIRKNVMRKLVIALSAFACCCRYDCFSMEEIWVGSPPSWLVEIYERRAAIQQQGDFDQVKEDPQRKVCNRSSTDADSSDCSLSLLVQDVSTEELPH
jgi:hypothetical protein